MHQDLRVGSSAELVSASLALTPQVHVVVQLSVEHNPDPAILVSHRLSATLEVHNTQASVTKRCRTTCEEVIAAPVWATVCLGVGQALDQGSHVTPSIGRQDTRNTAHQAHPSDRG